MAADVWSPGRSLSALCTVGECGSRAGVRENSPAGRWDLLEIYINIWPFLSHGLFIPPAPSLKDPPACVQTCLQPSIKK